MRAARQKLVQQYGEKNIIWAGYLLYGDPTVAFLKPPAKEGKAATPPDIAAMNEAPPQAMTAEMRAPEETIRFTSPAPRRRRLSGKRMAVTGAAALIVALLVLTGFHLSVWRITDRCVERAISAYRTGNFTEVERSCRRLQEKDPQRAISYLLLGNVSFLQGELDSARTHYQRAVSAPRGNAQDRAENRQRRERIDQLVEELHEQMASQTN